MELRSSSNLRVQRCKYLAISSHQLRRCLEHLHNSRYFKTLSFHLHFCRDISTLGFVPIELRFLQRRSAPFEQRKALQVSWFQARSTVFFPKELTFAIRLGHLDMVNRIPLIYYNLHQFTSIFNLNFFDSRFCISNGQDLTWSRWLPQLPNMHMQKPGSLWLWGGSTKYLQIPSSSIVLVCTYSDLFIKDWLMASLHQLDTLFTSWYHETLIMSIMFCELVRWNDWTESSTARAMFRNHNA